MRNIRSNIDEKNIGFTKWKFKKIKYNSILILVTFVVLLFFMIYYLGHMYKDENIYKNIVANRNSDVSTIKFSKEQIKLSDKSYKYIQNNLSNLIIESKDYSLVLYAKNIPKTINNDINYKFEKLNYDGFENTNGITIDLLGYENLTILKSIIIDIPKSLGNISYIDIYKVEDNSTLSEEKLKVEVKEGKIVFEPKNNAKYVIVYVPIASFKIKNLSEDKLLISKGTSFNLDLEILPKNATNKEVSFLTNTENIVISSEGVITAKETGDYEVSVKTNDINAEKKIDIKVVSVEFNSKKVSVVKGDTYNLNVTVKGESLKTTDFNFETSNKKIATVDKKGKITGKSVGSCEIIITKVDENTSLREEVSVTVKAKANIKISTSTYSSQEKVTGVTYIKGVLIVNKKYTLPSNYDPGVNQEALSALNSMQSDARSAYGYTMKLISGYRSYQNQQAAYQKYVNKFGQETADTLSAKPGTSEHQTGLAFDLTSLWQSYGSTPEGRWLANNCYKYGFIIRYPKNKEYLTGYIYEPWHVRYVGKAIAKEIFERNITLEQYLGI